MTLSSTQLLWRCRRGMLELDLFLAPFAEHVLPTLSAQGQAVFERLLDCTDPELYAWLTGQAQSDDTEFANLITQIRAYAKQND